MDAQLWTEWIYVASVGICGAYPPSLMGSPHLNVTCLITRHGSFHLYFRGRNKTQGHRRSTTHVIAPHEDVGQGFDHLLPYCVDVKCRHVGVCDRSEGDSEKLPSCVSFCLHLSTMEP